MLRLETERIWKQVDDGYNGHKFVIIILLLKETRIATCGDTQAHARVLHFYTKTHARNSRLSCSWFVL